MYGEQVANAYTKASELGQYGDDYLLGTNDSELIEGISNKLKLVCAYFLSCSKLSLIYSFKKLKNYKDEMNDFELYQSFTVHSEISKFINLFNDTLVKFAKNATDEEIVLDENIDVKSVDTDTNDFLELFSSWETWIYKNYIFDPLKDEINNSTLAGLNKKINSKTGHQWLKKKLKVDYRHTGSKSIGKTITVQSRRFVFNAFKVLAVFNVFTLLGSFLLEYLIHSDEMDEAFKKYVEGYDEGIDGIIYIEKVLASVNTENAKVIDSIIKAYKEFFKSSEVDTVLKANLRKQLKTIDKRLDYFFIGLNKHSSSQEMKHLYDQGAWSYSVEFNTYGNISNVEGVSLVLNPEKYIDFKNRNIKLLMKRWLLYNTDDSVYNVGFTYTDYPGPRDNDYYGPKTVAGYQEVANDYFGRQWKSSIGDETFGIRQIYGELYRLGIWNYELDSITSRKIRKKINTVKKESSAFSLDTSEIVEVELDVLISNENFVSPDVINSYLETIGSSITNNITAIKLSKVSLRVNQDYYMSYPHTALHSIEYEVISSASKASVTYENNRNWLD